MDSYHRYPLLRFHSVKYTILLALLPLVVWLLIPSEAVDAEVVETKRVKTETIKRTPQADFEARWFPIYDPPRRVRTIPIVKEEIKTEEQPQDNDQSARPLVAPNSRSIEPRTKHRRSVRYAYRDICSRHHMRRVITNGGRSWRCRRV